MGCDVATLALGGAMKAGGAADYHDLLWRWLGDRWEERIRVCFSCVNTCEVHYSCVFSCVNDALKYFTS